LKSLRIPAGGRATGKKALRFAANS